MEIQYPTAMLGFALGGRAIFSVENPRTGGRFTYKVVPSKRNENVYCVYVLTGSDNTNDYSLIGLIFAKPEGAQRPALRFRYKARGERNRRRRIRMDATSVAAFAWVWSNIRRNKSIAPARFYHEGRCARCGRPLTVPESIRLGFGPDCASQIGLVV